MQSLLLREEPCVWLLGCTRNQLLHIVGDVESGPVLTQKTVDGCMFEFEWQTAAACSLSHKTGTNCKVFDDEAGILVLF